MQRNFSIEEKLSAIGLVFQGESARSVSRKLHFCEYQESELTLCQLSAKYNISNSVISTWVKLAERDGFEALESHKSRHSKIGGHMVKRLSKDEFEKENERLRKENERLRLENLLLKKVRALVEEREARNRAIGRKPSKN